MDLKTFNDYEIAKISEDEESKIKNLEQRLKMEQNKDLVLIAYQQKGNETLA